MIRIEEQNDFSAQEIIFSFHIPYRDLHAVQESSLSFNPLRNSKNELSSCFENIESLLTYLSALLYES